MIKARHNRLYHAIISGFYRSMMAVHFRVFELHDHVEDSGDAILLIGNHVSWWDGFIGAEVNRRCWNRRFHVMMREVELRKRKFLQKVGAFSIRQGSCDAYESLQYAARILENPANLLLIFPQGSIASSYKRPLDFQNGIERVIEAARAEPQIIFSAAMFDYYSSIRPRLDVYTDKFKYDKKPTSNTLEAAYNRFYDKAVQKQKEASGDI